MKKIILIILLVLLPSMLFSKDEKIEKDIIIYTSYRYNAIPDFLLSPFYEEFESVTGHSFSLQSSFKIGNFAYTIDLDYMNLKADKDAYWRQKDKAPDWVIIDTTYLNLGINFEWFTRFTPKFEMITTLGIGIGTFLGELKRHKIGGTALYDNPTDFPEDNLKPPVFGHLLIAIGAQYEVYSIKKQNPIYLRINMGFKNSLFAGLSIGYQL